MLVIHSIELDQKPTSSIAVNWELLGSNEDFSRYRLSVLRSFAPSEDPAEYDLLGSGINPDTTSYYLDTDIMTVSDKILNLYYMIQISGLDGQGVSYSNPAKTMYQVTDKYAREIIRRRQIVFDHHSSTTAHIYIRKKTGTFCTNCYDPITQRTTISDCTTCYGTGYVGGYYAPITVRAQLSNQPVRETFQLFGAWQDQDGVVYMQAFPLVAPKDIIYIADRRWIVLTVGVTSKSEYSLSQIVHVRQIERLDIVNQLPIYLDDEQKY